MAMVFPTSPTVGQVFTSGSRSWVWNGSAWDSPSAINTLLAPYGLELINTTTFTSQTAINVANVFTSAYKNYQVYFHATGGTANADIDVRLSLSGTPSTVNYLASLVNASTTSTQGSFNFTSIFDTTNAGSSFQLFNPALAQKTGYQGNYYFDNGSTFINRVYGGVHRVATAYDGFQLISGSAFSGTITTFGVRNS